ncbi:MAG: helix-turn-helix domain-containing protein, partial [Clostridium saudiense]|nr:helix-turn-helix domain-containing protein [Clostridium saudiense]
DIRLQEAKRLLDETDMKIIEIGEAVGYENDKHFLKVFKGAYSVTSSEYRKNIKNGRMIVTL